VIEMKHTFNLIMRIIAGALLAATMVADAAETTRDAEPAVSGDALQNLKRGDAAAPAERAQEASAPAAGDRAPSQTAAPTPGARPQPASRPGARADRLELDTTVVTGNRELPKVLYIVPWKKADMGDLPAQPFNTLLDEVLTPVDRDVFRREVTYYEAVSSGADAGGAASARPAERSEK
jgi:hypothetical protein